MIEYSLYSQVNLPVFIFTLNMKNHHILVFLVINLMLVLIYIFALIFVLSNIILLKVTFVVFASHACSGQDIQAICENTKYSI